MPNNEINVNIEVDERKGAVAPLTAATDTFQPISPVTESADNVENLLGQGQQIISNIPVVGAMYSKGSSLISQATDGIYSSTTSQSLSPTSDSSYVYEIA